MNAIVEKVGRIDILVNNAGDAPPALSRVERCGLGFRARGRFEGRVHCVQAAAPHMIRQRYGKVLNISSISGTGASSHHAGGSPATPTTPPQKRA